MFEIVGLQKRGAERMLERWRFPEAQKQGDLKRWF